MAGNRLGRAVAAAVAALLVVGVAAPAAQAKPVKPATPTITSGPAQGSFTNQTSATFVFATTTATATLYCSLDGAKAAVCTSPKTYTGLKPRLHTFSVYAQLGKFKSGTASRSWTVDLTPPAAPTVTLTAPATSPTSSTSYSATLSDTSTDVQSYTCGLDGATPTPCTSPKTGSGLAEGYHSLTVFAVDKAGNVSTTAGYAGWAVDTSTPTPTISSGPALVTNATGATFTFSSTEPGVTFSCARDPNLNSYTACTSPKTYAAASFGNGSHSFRVKATDTLGNTAVSATYTWTVQAPAVASLAWGGGLPGAVTNQTSGSFAFTASGYSTLACVLDGVTQGSCTSPAAVSGLAEGSHTFALLADAGTGTQTSLSYAWAVDTTAPSSPTVEGPSGRVASSSASIVVVPGSINDTVTCTVDSVPRACTSAFTLTSLADGSHTVVATATDAAGNTAQGSLTWVVDTTAPVPSASDPTSVNGPVVVDFGEDVTGVTTDDVVLADELGVPLAATMSCRDQALAVTDCTGASVSQVRLTPSARLVPGEHYQVLVNPASALGAVTDVVGNAAADTTLAVRGPLSVSETSPAAAWTWRTVKSSKAKGGSYLTDHRKGAKVTWAFSGRSVSWVTVVGRTQGKATVLVDGVKKASVNNYAKSTRYGVTRTVKGLPKGKHTVTVVATGKKGARAGKGSFVSVDAFKVGTKLTATPKVTVAWQQAKSAGAAGGAYAAADLKGQSVRLTFRGTGITWVTATGKGYGKAALYVDGVLQRTVDGYSATAAWQVPQAVTGLADGTHTLVVKVLGTKNRKATGTAVVVDGFTVS